MGVSSLGVLVSADGVSVFGLAVGEWLGDGFRLVRAQFFALALVGSVAFFWDTRYIQQVKILEFRQATCLLLFSKLFLRKSHKVLFVSY